MRSASPFPPRILPPRGGSSSSSPSPLALLHPGSPARPEPQRERRAAAARPWHRLRDGRGGDHHLQRPDGEVQPAPGELQEAQTAVLQQRGALPAHPPGRHRGWHQGPQRPAHSAPAECRERGGGAHPGHAVGAVPGHGHQRAALRLAVTGRGVSVPGKTGGEPLQHLRLQNARGQELVCGAEEEREQQAGPADSLRPEGDPVPATARGGRLSWPQSPAMAPNPKPKPQNQLLLLLLPP